LVDRLRRSGTYQSHRSWDERDASGASPRSGKAFCSDPASRVGAAWGNEPSSPSLWGKEYVVLAFTHAAAASSRHAMMDGFISLPMFRVFMT
jgi:hypothetical protein